MMNIIIGGTGMGVHRGTTPFAWESARLNFLWLELTSRCNLTCVHCYAESGPYADVPDGLSAAEYVTLLDDAAGLGCRRVQFIGGEPTLHPSLASLIAHARSRDYEFVEVFTNGIRISDDLLS